MGTKKRMLPLLLAAMFMLSLLPSVAVANAEEGDSTFPTLMPTERILLEMAGESDGLISTVVRENGLIDITVTAADWEKVLFSAAGLGVSITATPPGGLGITRYQIITGGFDDDGLEEAFQTRSIFSYDGGARIGESLAQVKETLSGTLAVPKSVAGRRVAICWWDDVKAVQTEIFTINIKHLNTNAKYITTRMPSEERVTRNATNVTGIRSEYIEGTGVNYFAEDIAALTGQMTGGRLNIVTKVLPPVGAAFYKYGNSPFIPVGSGAYECSTNVADNGIVNKGHGSSEPQIYWYDADKTLILQETFRIDYYYAEGGAVWPEIGGRWKKLPKERIEEYNGLGVSGINIVEDDGRVGITFSKTPLPALDAASLRGYFGTPTKIFEITPPEGAVSYQRNDSYLPAMDGETTEMIEGMLEASEPIPILPGEPVLCYAELAQTAQLENGLMRVYFSTEDRAGFANTYLFDWKLADGSIVSEYVMITIDKFGYVTETAAVASETNLTAPVSNPTIIGDTGWKLRTEYQPQSGEDALFYELSLKDGAGNNLNSIDGGATVVLPFPGEMTYEEALTCRFVIRHYKTDLSAYEELTAEVKPYGLVFTAASFSPYLLEWGNTVTFDAGEGVFAVSSEASRFLSVRAGDGQTIAAPEEGIYWWGHAFRGWCKEASCENAWNFETGTVNDDITLYAKWEAVEPTITITEQPAKLSYTEGDALDLCGLQINALFDDVYDPAGWDVKLQEFPDFEITTEPVNGAALTTANTKVTITVMGKSVELPITVEAKSSSEGGYGNVINPAVNTVTDSSTTKTGVSVTGALPAGAVLTVGELLLPPKGVNAAADAIRAEMGRRDAVVLIAKEIKLSTSFTGKLAVTLPVDAKYNGQTVTILHDRNGTLERYTAVVKNGQVVFEVDGLSPFVVLLYAKAVSVPNTGASTGAFPFVLLVMAGIVAAGVKRVCGKGR